MFNRLASVLRKRVAVPLPFLVILCLPAFFIPLIFIVGVFSFSNMRSGPAQESTTCSTIVELLSASQDYYADCKRWPILDKDARALFLNDGTANWNGPYLPKHRRKEGNFDDAWGSFYTSRIVGNRLYLISPGADRMIDTADDLKGWVTPFSKVNIEGSKEFAGRGFVTCW